MGTQNPRLLFLTCRIKTGIFCPYTGEKAQTEGVFQVYGMPEALPYYGTSSIPIPLGYCTYILDNRMAEGSLVR
jgi:hypothetical protein